MEALQTDTFLAHVAGDLLAKHGGDLSRLTVVFPNKRASLFLNAHLSRLAGRPIWSPHYTTISELFMEQSSRTVAEPIKLVCELYRSFTAQTGIDETLDHFYGWGQLLLSDFDDIDKSMADADRVFANLRDLHEMDSTDYLSEEQREAIRKFFSTFTADHSSLLRERFLKLWSHMADVYHDFNGRLERQQIAYEGALYREVVEGLQDGGGLRDGERWQCAGYVFVGFNVLQQVERRLFTWLRREGKARFYWDYDEDYRQSEAGAFIAENMALFPNELDNADETVYKCFSRPKDIAVVSAPTENIQARYAAQWLSQLGGAPAPSSPGACPDTAIVLCDEKLLPTVIHCLPGSVDHVNVTTGYPLGQTPVASLLATLFALRTQGYQPSRDRYRLRQVNALLRHPYIARLSAQVEALDRRLNEQKIYYPGRQQLCSDEATTLLFRDLEHGGGPQAPATAAAGGNAALLQWMCDVVRTIAVSAARDAGAASAPPSAPGSPGTPSGFNIEAESLFRAYTLLNRLLALVAAGDLTVDVITLQRLLAQLLQTTTIPFHGEPAKGLQVMGVLETRCLDFRHVLMLSAGEGNMPKGVSDTSFIPHALRKAYGLTTADRKTAIYSYYFHRLLQRAADVTIVYNNSTADGHSGEVSRFVLQLMVEDRHHHIATRTLQTAQAFSTFLPRGVERTAATQQKLVARFAAAGDAQPRLTPTAINRYLRCPLMFYYTYAYDLREPDTTDDDTIDNRLFGNIFHEAARIVYTQLTENGRQVTAGSLEQLLRKRAPIETAVDKAIGQELFHLEADGTRHGPPDLSGLQIINRAVIIHYLRQLLTIDSHIAPFTIEGLETDVALPLHTSNLDTVVGGRIDRLDRIVKDGRETMRVIDYKTGSHVPTPLAGVEAIFEQEQLKNHSDYYLQTFLYSIIVGREHKATPVAPALLFIQHAGADDYNPVLKFGKEHIADVAPHEETFMNLLTATIDEMFDPSMPFEPTPDRTRCTNCPYRMLCR